MKKLQLVIYFASLFSITTLQAGEKYASINSETIGLVERMNINKIDLPLNNNGSTGEDAQAYYPNGQTNLSFLFSGGFATTAYVNGELRASWIAPASLIEEWQPGTWGMDPANPLAKFYIINSGDGFGSTNYIEWQQAVNLGADFQDLDGNGLYDPFVDKPATTGDRMIWFPVNDNTDLIQRNPRLNTLPIGLEVHITAWAWDRNDEFEDAVFFRYRIINATDTLKNDLIFSIWADSDIGNADDDLIGCDTTISLGYTCNDNFDNQYGSNPPAFGIQFLQGAIVPATGDTAHRIYGNFLGIDTLVDMRNLPMTSLLMYGNISTILGDPTYAWEARYFQIGGLDIRGNIIDPTSWGTGGTINTNPKYFYSGDPVTGSGWVDSQSADKRFLINCGPFNLAIGDTQDIIIAYIVGQGANALESITELKSRANYIANNFNIITGFKNMEHDVVKRFYLSQNYPNPFNPTTTIIYELPKTAHVKIEIFDILGQSVKTLANQKQNRGEHAIVWDGLNSGGNPVSGGIYFYQLKTEDYSQTRKMLLLK